MPQTPNTDPILHDAVVSPPILGKYRGRSRVTVDVRCPRCSQTRTRPASEIRKEMKRPNFKGYCRQCSFEALRSGEHRWFNYRRKQERTNHKSGYIAVSPMHCPDELLPIYRAMQKSGQFVMEHRLVMAAHLGRLLLSTELVDHMNGNKTDNRIENLRLYVRGLQQPGSAPGHGTYYDEWQRALARIKDLESQIQKMRDKP